MPNTATRMPTVRKHHPPEVVHGFSTPAFTTALSNDSDTSMAANTAASVTGLPGRR